MQQQTNIFNTPKGKGERMTNSKALEALNRIKTIYPSGIMASVYGQCTASMMALKQDLDELQLALTELEEIKKRAEEKKRQIDAIQGKTYTVIAMPAEEIKAVIDYILEGETK